MAKVNLKSLGINFWIGIFDSYEDHNFVENFEKEIKKFKNYSSEDIEIIKSAETSILLKVSWPIKTYYHSYYKKLPNEDDNIFNKGRTETIFLDKIGKLEKLTQKMKESRMLFNLNGYDKDKIANVGGVFALVREKRFDNPHLSYFISDIKLKNDFREAREIVYNSFINYLCSSNI